MRITTKNKIFIVAAFCVAFLFMTGELSMFAQTAAEALQQTEATLRGIGGTLMTVLQLICGLIGGVMLIWNFAQRSKNDGQSNDKIFGWAIALLAAMIGLYVIKTVFKF